ncbi:MAG: Holliday junction DNA helicase RuvA [Thermoguttaceae bacterium]|nr:Holliday junction DNA helicase RuvA [Thermoguttaceae bacterium]
MIVKITGKLVALYNDRAIIEAAPFEYETLIPEFTRRQLQSELQKTVSLYTLEYIDGAPNQGRLVPRLLGFLTDVEREFFEIFCSVDGVGTKKALRAMVRPVREIAEMIEQQEHKALATLPGIGPATAERIVAKLRRKVSKALLMTPRPSDALADVDLPSDVVNDAYLALIGLGHSEAEARRLVDELLAKSKRKFKDSAEILQAIWDNR